MVFRSHTVLSSSPRTSIAEGTNEIWQEVRLARLRAEERIIITRGASVVPCYMRFPPRFAVVYGAWLGLYGRVVANGCRS